MNQPPSNLGRRGFLGTITGSVLAFAYAPWQRFLEWLKDEQTIAVEEALLSCLLIEPSLMNTALREFNDMDFTFWEDMLIFESLAEMHLRGEVINVITLTLNLRERNNLLEDCGGAEEITRISMLLPTAASYQHYAKKFQKLAAEKHERIEKLRARIYSGRRDRSHLPNT